MAETIGTAFIAIRPEVTGFSSQAQGKLAGEGKKMGKQFGGMFAAGAGIAVGVFLKGAFAEAQEAQKIGAQTAAVIKSTGGAAQVSAPQVEKLAGQLSKMAGVDDEIIQAGENMLLTFKNVRNEQGKGNDVFNQATKATLDMAVGMKAANGGQVDLKGTAIQLGKALNDPIKGVVALGRAGVQFTDQQKEQIAAMVESGDLLGAQKIILKEVQDQFGGSAAAQATATDKMKVAFGNLQETIGTLLIPAMNGLIGVLEPMVRWLSENEEIAAALAITVGVVLVAAFVAWALAAGAAAVATIAAMWPVLLAIAAIGLAIAGGAILWKRYGDKVVEFLQPAISAVEALAGAARKVLEWLGLVDEKQKQVARDWQNGPGKMGPPLAPMGPPTAAGTVMGQPFQRGWKPAAVGGPVGPGLLLVGEKGPELLHLAGHGRIDSAQATAGKFTRSGGLTIAGDLVVRDTSMIADLDYWTMTRLSGV